MVDLANAHNELEKKTADVRAAKGDCDGHYGKLMEAERRLEDLQNELKELQKQLQKEIEDRKV